MLAGSGGAWGERSTPGGNGPPIILKTARPRFVKLRRPLLLRIGRFSISSVTTPALPGLSGDLPSARSKSAPRSHGARLAAIVSGVGCLAIAHLVFAAMGVAGCFVSPACPQSTKLIWLYGINV